MPQLHPSHLPPPSPPTLSSSPPPFLLPPSLPPQGGLYKGIAMGSNYGVCFLGFALLFYYAAVLVAGGAATGGTALATMFSVLVGGL